jgi:outer membrane autotransporter protein
LLEDSRFVRDATLDRLQSADANAGWVRVFGFWGSTGSDGNAAELDRDSSGVVVGADAELDNDARLGLIASYSRNNSDTNARNSSSESRNLYLGAYAGGVWDNLALRAGAAYGWHDLESSRAVSFTGFTDNLRSNDGKATSGQVFGELGYRLNSIEPFANLAFVSLDMDGFTEQGGNAALRVQDASTDTSFSTLGVHLQNEFTTGRFKGTLGWRHAFGDTTPLSTLSFASGNAFTVAGVPIAENAAVLDLGLDFSAGENARFGLSYNGQFGSGASDNGVRAEFEITF